LPLCIFESPRRGHAVRSRTYPADSVGPGRPLRPRERNRFQWLIAFREFLTFTTIRGICFRSRSKITGWNGSGSDTVLVQRKSRGMSLPGIHGHDWIDLLYEHGVRAYCGHPGSRQGSGWPRPGDQSFRRKRLPAQSCAPTIMGTERCSRRVLPA